MDDPRLIINQSLKQLRDRADCLSVETVKLFANQAISFFFDYYHSTQQVLREAIELLCRINILPDPNLSRIGVNALFPKLIERLNDAFDPAYCKLYDEVFSQVISFCRAIPEGHKLDSTLTQFGLPDELSLLKRIELLRQKSNAIDPNAAIKKIILLSRITIGADVAISSVILSHLKKIYPYADLVIIGPSKLSDLYGGDAQVRISPLNYERTDSLIGRLTAWLSVLDIVQAEISSLSADQFYIFDPDSRLTQLGILPLLPPSLEFTNYFLFPSRTLTQSNISKLGQLTSHWINQFSADCQPTYPYVSLPPLKREIGTQLRKYFWNAAKPTIICISFGYGGNISKRVTASFEQNLVKLLSRDYKIFLDFGFTQQESEEVEAILKVVTISGKQILRLDEQNFSSYLNPALSNYDLIAWKGGIGSFASLISASNYYIGYDSSGQHIAAALGIPLMTVFVNSGSSIFADRWQPFGAGKSQIINISPKQNYNEDILLDQIVTMLHRNMNLFP